jgi:hypothetical protein
MYEYHPAADGWLFLVRGDLIVGLEPAAGRDVIERLWSRDSADPGPADVLEALTAKGFAAAPAFVVVDRDGGGVRVIVRGDVAVRVGDELVSGVGVSTWTERVLPAGSVSVTVRDPGSAGPLPIESGVVVASGLAVRGATPAAAPPGVASAEPPAANPAAVTPPASAAIPPAPVTPAPVAPASPQDPHATLGSDRSMSMVSGVAPEVVDAAATSEPPADGYGFLFDRTMARSVEQAAVREPEAADATPEIERTTFVTDRTAARNARRAAKVPRSPAPSLYLEFSSGQRELLDQPVLVGRSPSAERVSGGRIPRLVRFDTPADISRRHVQFDVEGGTVVVTDLLSTNGTTIELPGQAPQRLRPNEPTSVIPGTVVDLGDGATIVVKVEGA